MGRVCGGHRSSMLAMHACGHHEMVGLLAGMQLDASSAECLFDALDIDGSGELGGPIESVLACYANHRKHRVWGPRGSGESF